MPRNFFRPKTGHEPSDKWLQQQPVFFDSDILFSGLYGFIAGIVIGGFLTITLLP